MKEGKSTIFSLSNYTVSHDVLVYFDLKSLLSLRKSCSELNESVADALSPIMIRLMDQSDFVSESAVGDIYRERESKGNGRLRKVKSLSELNVDHMLARLCEVVCDSSPRVTMTSQDKMATTKLVPSFRTDVRLLKWIYQSTRPRLWLIGGGSIVEGDKSYMRVDNGDIRDGKTSEMSQLSRRRGTFFTYVKSYRGGITVIGGESAISIGTLELYDPIQNKWTLLPDMPEKLQYSGSAVDKDDLLVSGGLNHSVGGCSNEVYRLSHSKKEWIHEKAMCLPDRRFGHASLVTADGKLWVFGGNIAMVCNEDIPEERYEVYNPSDSVLYFDRNLGDSGEWHECAAMGATRIWLSVFDVDGYLYAVGGDADRFGKVHLPTIERYDRQQDLWETITFFPEMRKIYSCTEHDGKIVIVGGRSADYSAVTSLNEFDLRTGQWREYPDVVSRFNRDSFIGGGVVVQSLSASTL